MVGLVVGHKHGIWPPMVSCEGEVALAAHFLALAHHCWGSPHAHGALEAGLQLRPTALVLRTMVALVNAPVNHGVLAQLRCARAFGLTPALKEDACTTLLLPCHKASCTIPRDQGLQSPTIRLPSPVVITERRAAWVLGVLHL